MAVKQTRPNGKAQLIRDLKNGEFATKTCESPASLYLFLQFLDFLQWELGGC